MNKKLILTIFILAVLTTPIVFAQASIGNMCKQKCMPKQGGFIGFLRYIFGAKICYQDCGNSITPITPRQCTSDQECTIYCFTTPCPIGKCVEGLCTYTPAEYECKYLYWFDNFHKECGYKQFCGAYMWSGLKTFNTLEECQKALVPVPKNECEVPADCEDKFHIMCVGSWSCEEQPLYKCGSTETSKCIDSPLAKKCVWKCQEPLDCRKTGCPENQECKQTSVCPICSTDKILSSNEKALCMMPCSLSWECVPKEEQVIITIKIGAEIKEYTVPFSVAKWVQSIIENQRLPST